MDFAPREKEAVLTFEFWETLEAILIGWWDRQT
jgi:hypothetical protein